LDEKAGFSAHFNGEAMDPLNHFWLSSPFASETAPLRKHVNVSVNGQDGLIRVETQATDAQSAQLFAQTVLAEATSWVETGLENNQSTGSIRLLTEPTLPTATDFPARLSTLILCFLGFLALYAILSIFGRTLLRHGSR